VQLLLVLRRISGIVQATQKEKLRFERRDAVAYVEGIYGLQVMVLGHRSHLTVPLYQLLSQARLHELHPVALRRKPLFVYRRVLCRA
jgi:hypothetical protein